MKAFVWGGILALCAALAAPTPGSAAPDRMDRDRTTLSAGADSHDYATLAVSIPNHLNRAEARRRLNDAILDLQRDYGLFFTLEQETWRGYRLHFRARVLGQPAVGSLDITRDRANLKVVMPSSLTMIVNIAQPAILKQGTSLLAK
jgi:hypothetical protein